MVNISKFVIWICKKFNREHIQLIVSELQVILKDPYAEIQPKDTFKEDHPNYRNFEVDSNPALKEKPKKKRQKTTRRS